MIYLYSWSVSLQYHVLYNLLQASVSCKEVFLFFLKLADQWSVCLFHLLCILKSACSFWKLQRSLPVTSQSSWSVICLFKVPFWNLHAASVSCKEVFLLLIKLADQWSICLKYHLLCILKSACSFWKLQRRRYIVKVSDLFGGSTCFYCSENILYYLLLIYESCTSYQLEMKFLVLLFFLKIREETPSPSI